MSSLYPPLTRTSGFSFAHNVAMSLMGGLAPTVVTVRRAAPRPAARAPFAICEGEGVARQTAFPPPPPHTHTMRARPQAIAITSGNTLTAPGWYMLACTLLSMAAGAAIMAWYPAANRAPPAPDMAVELAR